MAAVIEHEPCYIYHVRDFQEHSQILEALSLNYGALAIVVNKNRRGNSSTQGIFQPFTPLKLSLKRSRGELFYLTDYDCSEPGYTFPLPQHFCAVYINELLCHLYRGKEQDVKLFGAYVSTLEAINNKQNIEQSLRLFELTLLESMGYALTLRDDEGILLDKDSYYRFCFGAGFFKVDPDAMSAVIAQEEAMKLGANHKTDLSERYTPVSSYSAPNDDSGMMFPKSKVRGRRLEDSSSSYSFNRVDTSDAYISRVMRSGFADEEYLQRYQDLSRDFMGPVLTGEQIRDIVRCDFTLPDSIKLAKQLTGAIIERLLNGKEIASRRLYREYAQMRNAKIKARKEAALAASAQGNEAASKDAVTQTTSTQEASEATPKSSTTNSQDNQTNASNDVLDSTGLTSSEPKKQLFFEAYPDKGNHTNEPSKQDYPEFSRPEEIPYISQFDYVHNCVPRDKHDAPEFLCEYLNLGNHNQPIPAPQVTARVGAASVPEAPMPSIPQSKVEDSAQSVHTDSAASTKVVPSTEVAQTQEPVASQLSQTQRDPANTDESKESTSKVESLTENNAQSVPQQDLAETTTKLQPNAAASQLGVVEAASVSGEDSVAGTKASSKAKTSDVKASTKAQPKDESVASKPVVADASAVSYKEEVLESKASAMSSITKATSKAGSKAKPKTATRSGAAKLKEAEKKAQLKAKAEAKKEADKLKAAEKKAAQKAALKAKAEAKKEAERLKAAAKKEALKLKAAEKKASQKAALKAKAEAKKEAERLKAAAKKEAEKLKAAEKKAALKAKSAALKAANKEKAKAKAKADAEAKEAQIDREFAHSMLAMLDTGMKRRQRQSKQNVLSDDET